MKTKTKATMNYVTLITIMKKKANKFTSLNQSHPTNKSQKNFLRKQSVGGTINQTSQPKEGTH